jgi:dethiobiotin synthetase
MSGIFVTATGTGIGKTYVTQQLLHWDRAHHCQFSASKPVISGWPQVEEEIQHTDTGLLCQAQQQICTSQLIDQVSPWRYIHALTPSMASAKEGKALNPAALINHCQGLLQQAKQAQKIHLIEGVGGVMAPLASQYTVLEWMQQLGCPCIVVVGSYLGTLSHALTALATLQMKGIDILCVVVNETVESSVSLAETCACLAAMISPIKVLALSYEKNAQGTNAGISDLYSHLSGLLCEF